jgi:hypothetical protein
MPRKQLEAARCAARPPGRHVEQVGTEPAWTAGNIVWDPETSLAAFRSRVLAGPGTDCLRVADR